MSSYLSTTKRLFSSHGGNNKTPQIIFIASVETLVTTKPSSFIKRKENVFLPICFLGIVHDLTNKSQANEKTQNPHMFCVKPLLTATRKAIVILLIERKPFLRES